MELLQLLIKDYIRERENDRFEKQMSKNFPCGQTIRLTEIKQDLKSAEMDVTTAESKEETEKMTVGEGEIQTMQEYEELGALDMDLQEQQEEQYVEEAYCEAKACCTHFNMECEREADFLYITTDAGKWYFRPKKGKITLYHKNYELRRNQPESYHEQFTKNCSVREILWYIYKHDQRKKRRSKKKR